MSRCRHSGGSLFKSARRSNFRRLLRELTENKARSATSERRAFKFRNEVRNSKVQERERQNEQKRGLLLAYTSGVTL